jgi:hypothetical protein
MARRKGHSVDEQTNDGRTPEQQMTHLLCHLERTVRRPTFSYRLEEIHAIVVEIEECWAMYRRGERQAHTGVP